MSFRGGVPAASRQKSFPTRVLRKIESRHRLSEPPPRTVAKREQLDAGQGQDSAQHASNPTLQQDQAYTVCTTTGNCDADIHIQQQGQNFRNSCTGNSCDFGLVVNGGKSFTCGGDIGGNEEGGGCDVSFPPPPPPPTRGGCEFE